MGLKELVEISHFYGKTLDYVLAGGGNTSFKDDGFLYVKASGYSLSNICEDNFVKLCLTSLNQTLSSDTVTEDSMVEELDRAKSYGEYAKVPSIESLLHAVIPFTYVVHLHPALINGITCIKESKEKSFEILGNEIIWIESTIPGYELAKKVQGEISKYNDKFNASPTIILIENHGIFVAGNDCDDIKKTYDEIMKKLKFNLKSTPDFSLSDFDAERAAYISPALRMILKNNDSSIVTFTTNKTIMEFVANREAFAPVSTAYTPDHIVYCKPYPLFVEWMADIDEQYSLIQSEIENYNKKYGFAPVIIAIQNLGIFAHGVSKKVADTAMLLFIDNIKIGFYAKSFGQNQFISDELITFINGWSKEEYRKKIFEGTNAFRISEKIAIVTGSAQGFGQGVAEEMVKSGANMVIADLNYELAEANVNDLCSKYGKGKAIAIKVDVSDEESVASMIINTVLAYGGLDVFVNNAGIVKAGSLEEMTLANLDFVTRVNYNAYFLGAKYASRIMKIQNRYNKDYYTDIIQINSKSGLSGSNKNFAYAGSKFGGIGLTQSFALELIEYNIKVNSICPGNFFEGPLWSDPLRGLFVQYLNAGKIPGAKTVLDVKKSYESKVPMNRGCRVMDVARAIFYCMEQQYETGQAIPVTGGQNMLK